MSNTESATASATMTNTPLPRLLVSLATYDEPHQYAAGISTVIVNGTVVIDGGDHTGALPGRVLRFPRRAA